MEANSLSIVVGRISQLPRFLNLFPSEKRKKLNFRVF